jgi:hypothetical protein
VRNCQPPDDCSDLALRAAAPARLIAIVSSDICSASWTRCAPVRRRNACACTAAASGVVSRPVISEFLRAHLRHAKTQIESRMLWFLPNMAGGVNRSVQRRLIGGGRGWPEGFVSSG